MARLDTIYMEIGDAEVAIEGYCTGDGFEIEDVKIEDTSVFDLLLGLETEYGFKYAWFQQRADEECEDYIDRVYNPENQV